MDRINHFGGKELVSNQILSARIKDDDDKPFQFLLHVYGSSVSEFLIHFLNFKPGISFRTSSIHRNTVWLQ